MECTAPKPGQASPVSFLRHEQDFPGTPHSISESRDWITSTLTAQHVTPPESLVLVVSELATNVIRHTRSGTPGGRYNLRITGSADLIHLEVRDAGPLPGRIPTCQHAHPDDLHGRGLVLVDVLASRWGTLAGDSGVWAEIAR